MRTRTYGRGHQPATHQITQSDLGREDPPRVADTKPPKGWEQRQRQQVETQTAMLNAWHQVAAHLGGILDLAKAPPAGDVLGESAHIIGANGFSQIRFPVPFAALHIANLSAGTLTVQSGPPQSFAPAKGPGVFSVPAGIARTVSARDTVVTVYGAVGAVYDITAYARPRDPFAGPLTTSSGGGSSVTPAGVAIAAGTTATTTVTIPSITFTRLVVVLSVTAGAGSVDLAINGISPSGYAYPLLAPGAVSGASVTPYRIGAALSPSPGAVANDVIPDLVQIVATVVAPCTYGVDWLGGK